MTQFIDVISEDRPLRDHVTTGAMVRHLLYKLSRANSERIRSFVTYVQCVYRYEAA